MQGRLMGLMSGIKCTAAEIAAVNAFTIERRDSEFGSLGKPNPAWKDLESGLGRASLLLRRPWR